MSPDTAPTLDLDALEQAVEWVSGIGFGNEAYVSRQSGRIVWVGEGVEDQEEEPEALQDGSLYLAVPHKNKLDLGKTLALQFAEEHLASQVSDVHDMFRRRGAYGQFKNLLQRRGLLDAWHAYQNNVTRQALQQWATENGFIPEPHVQRRKSDA